MLLPDPRSYLIETAQELDYKGEPASTTNSMRTKNIKPRYEPDIVQGWIQKSLNKLKRYQNKAIQSCLETNKNIFSEDSSNDRKTAGNTPVRVKMVSSDHFALIGSNSISIYRLGFSPADNQNIVYTRILNYELNEVIECLDVQHVRNDEFMIVVVSSNENKVYSLRFNGQKKFEINEKICGVCLLDHNQLLLFFEHEIRRQVIGEEGVTQMSKPTHYNSNLGSHEVSKFKRLDSRNDDSESDGEDESEPRNLNRVIESTLIKREGEYVYVILKVQRTKEEADKMGSKYEIILYEFEIEPERINLTIQKVIEDYDSITLEDIYFFQTKNHKENSMETNLLVVMDKSVILVKKKSENGKFFFSVECNLEYKLPAMLVDMRGNSNQDDFLLIKNDEDAAGHKKSLNTSSTAITDQPKFTVMDFKAKKTSIYEAFDMNLKDIIWMKRGWNESTNAKQKNYNLLKSGVYKRRLIFFIEVQQEGFWRLEISFTKQVKPEQKLLGLLPRRFQRTYSTNSQSLQDSSTLEKVTSEQLEYLSEIDLKLLQKLTERYNEGTGPAQKIDIYKLIWNNVKNMESSEGEDVLIPAYAKYLYFCDDLKYINDQFLKLIIKRQKISKEYIKKHYHHVKKIAKNKMERLDPSKKPSKSEEYKNCFKVYIQATFYIKKINEIAERHLRELDYSRWLKKPIFESDKKEWRLKPSKLTRFRERYRSFYIYHYQNKIIGQLLRQQKGDFSFLKTATSELWESILPWSQLVGINPQEQGEKDYEYLIISYFKKDDKLEENCFDRLSIKNINENLDLVMQCRPELEEKLMVDNDFLFMDSEDLLRIQMNLCTDSRAVYIFIAKLHESYMLRDTSKNSFPDSRVVREAESQITEILDNLRNVDDQNNKEQESYRLMLFLPHNDYWRIKLYLRIFEALNQFEESQETQKPHLAPTIWELFQKGEYRLYWEIMNYKLGEAQDMHQQMKHNIKFMLGTLHDLWEQVAELRQKEIIELPLEYTEKQKNNQFRQFGSGFQVLMSPMVWQQDNIYGHIVEILKTFLAVIKEKRKFLPKQQLILEHILFNVMNIVKLSDRQSIIQINNYLNDIDTSSQAYTSVYKQYLARTKNLVDIFVAFKIDLKIRCVQLPEMQEGQAQQENMKKLIKTMIQNYINSYVVQNETQNQSMYCTNGLKDLLLNMQKVVNRLSPYQTEMYYDFDLKKILIREVLGQEDKLAQKIELLKDLTNIVSSDETSSHSEIRQFYHTQIGELIKTMKRKEAERAQKEVQLRITEQKNKKEENQIQSREAELKRISKQRILPRSEIESLQESKAKFRNTRKELEETKQKLREEQQRYEKVILKSLEILEAKKDMLVSRQVAKEKLILSLKKEQLSLKIIQDLFKRYKVTQINELGVSMGIKSKGDKQHELGKIYKLKIRQIVDKEIQNRAAELESPEGVNSLLKDLSFARNHVRHSFLLYVYLKNKSREQRLEPGTVNLESKSTQFSDDEIRLLDIFFQNPERSFEDWQSFFNDLPAVYAPRTEISDRFHKFDQQIFRYVKDYYLSLELMIVGRMIKSNYKMAMQFILRYQALFQKKENDVLTIIRLHLREKTIPPKSDLLLTIQLLGNLLKENMYTFEYPDKDQIAEILKANNKSMFASSLREFNIMYIHYYVTEDQKTKKNDNLPDYSKNSKTESQPKEEKHAHPSKDSNNKQPDNKQYLRDQSIFQQAERMFNEAIKPKIDQPDKSVGIQEFKRKQKNQESLKKQALQDFISFVENNSKDLCRLDSSFNMDYFRIFVKCVKYDEDMKYFFDYDFFFKDIKRFKTEPDPEKETFFRDIEVVEHLKDKIKENVRDDNYLKVGKALKFVLHNSREIEQYVFRLHIQNLASQARADKQKEVENLTLGKYNLVKNESSDPSRKNVKVMIKHVFNAMDSKRALQLKTDCLPFLKELGEEFLRQLS